MWLGRAALSLEAIALLAPRGHDMTKWLAALALFSTLTIGPSFADACGGAAFAQTGCCKVCKKGKACGDSCISVDKNCTKGVGCACDG